ncbi:hypothetical protein R6Q57_011278, partial [Mikania cordata]
SYCLPLNALTVMRGIMRCSLLVRYNPEGLVTVWSFRQVIKRYHNWTLRYLLRHNVGLYQLWKEYYLELLKNYMHFKTRERFAPSLDPSLSIEFYERTHEQDASLGFAFDPTQSSEASFEPHGSVGALAGRRAIAQGNSPEFAEALFRYTAPEEVMTFPSTCGACAVSCETRMFLTKIPYFQEVIVMASTCDACGYRNSELKPGGAIPAKGKKISVLVKDTSDLSRDVIKSDTASVLIPEIDLELTSGTLGGMVTTIEGLVTRISEALERVHGFTFGDSLEEGRKNKWLNFRERLIKLLSLEETWTLIMDDALANSFIAPSCDAIKDDHQLTIEEYERSWEQNEELGLNDMDTSAADAAY